MEIIENYDNEELPKGKKILVSNIENKDGSQTYIYSDGTSST
jgi:hypothetical protein